MTVRTLAGVRHMLHAIIAIAIVAAIAWLVYEVKRAPYLDWHD